MTGLVLLDDSKFGKTGTISHFVKGTFNSNYLSNEKATLEEKTIEIPEMKINFTFKVWDVAILYRNFFVKFVKIVVLVYDITKQLSYDIIKEVFYSRLKNYCSPNIVIGTAGNKSDLYDEKVVSEQ